MFESIDQLVISDIKKHLGSQRKLKIVIDLKVEGPGTYNLLDGNEGYVFTPFSYFSPKDVRLQEGESLVRVNVMYGKNFMAVFEYDLQKEEEKWIISSLNVILGSYSEL